MITVLIVEDEQPALDRLTLFLQEQVDIQLIGSARTGREGALLIDAQKPDLVFLDIHLPDISGLDLLRIITHQPFIIFTTAYNQYAVQAFELQAVDYLLKPFSEDRLQQALQRVREKTGQNVPPELNTLKNLLARYGAVRNTEYLTRIPSKIGDKIYILADDDIIYLASEERIVFAHLYETKYIINYTLDELQARLNPDKFFRIHRSTLVNLNYISLIESWFAGGYKTRMKDKQSTELIISRTAGKQLRQKLGW
jgi:two-component system, LytTR family, response regulator